MRYYLDTEFDVYPGQLISLALVREDGLELYVAVNQPVFDPWVAQNVIPILAVPGACPIMLTAPDFFGPSVAEFLSGDADPAITADWPDDIRYMCAAVITGPGQMVDIPSLRFEVKRVDAYPTTLVGAVQHNALWDARALRHLLEARP